MKGWWQSGENGIRMHAQSRIAKPLDKAVADIFASGIPSWFSTRSSLFPAQLFRDCLLQQR